VKLPSCLLVILLGVLLDVPLITVVALWKSPYMLFRGWKRLLEDLIGREGPFLEAVCVPFAALAIILWPLAVVGAVISAFFASFFLGLYGGAIVRQVCLNFPLFQFMLELQTDVNVFLYYLFLVQANVRFIVLRKTHF